MNKPLSETHPTLWKALIDLNIDTIRHQPNMHTLIKATTFDMAEHERIVNAIKDLNHELAKGLREKEEEHERIVQEKVAEAAIIWNDCSFVLGEQSTLSRVKKAIEKTRTRWGATDPNMIAKHVLDDLVKEIGIDGLKEE
jgi:uncharacterized membrane-anchored protein YjiN (DUF445 family)